MKEFAAKNNIRVYLFGSCLSSDHPGDIDILIVYDNSIVSIDSALRVRSDLYTLLSQVVNIPCDICLLSEDEVRCNSFIQAEKGHLLAD